MNLCIVKRGRVTKKAKKLACFSEWCVSSFPHIFYDSCTYIHEIMLFYLHSNIPCTKWMYILCTLPFHAFHRQSKKLNVHLLPSMSSLVSSFVMCVHAGIITDILLRLPLLYDFFVQTKLHFARHKKNVVTI
jgi:hypothetical protein